LIVQRDRLPLLFILALIAAPGQDALAGMPSALPEDFERLFWLKESTSHRLQAISFFAFTFVAATVAFWGLWNNLARSFTTLPRLNLARAACLTLLLGSLFIVVLTMISGARELLTPGAWRKQGATYTLAPSDADAGASGSARGSQADKRDRRLAAKSLTCLGNSSSKANPFATC